MTRQFKIRAKAKQEARKAREYFDEQREGLGKEFKGELQAIFDQIEAGPLIFREYEPGVRRALVNRFHHYMVFFAVDDDKIAIYAIIHQRRDPGYTQQRIAEEREEEL